MEDARRLGTPRTAAEEADPEPSGSSPSSSTCHPTPRCTFSMISLSSFISPAGGRGWNSPRSNWFFQFAAAIEHEGQRGKHGRLDFIDGMGGGKSVALRSFYACDAEDDHDGELHLPAMAHLPTSMDCSTFTPLRISFSVWESPLSIP